MSNGVETAAIRQPLAGRQVTVAGLQLQTSEGGTGAPPFVVLHHSTGPLWTPFYDALAAQRAVVAPDLSGYGRSERPDAARSPRDLAILWLRALDELEPDPCTSSVSASAAGWRQKSRRWHRGGWRR